MIIRNIAKGETQKEIPSPPKERRYTMSFMLAIMLAIVFAVTPAMSGSQKTLATSESPTGMTCMTNMKGALEPARSSMRRVVFSTTDDYGEKVRFIAGQAYKNVSDGNRMVLVILEPKSIRGMTYLFSERENRLDKWVYLPTIRRVLEVKPNQAYEPFLGTEFSVSDIGLVPIPKACELIEVVEHTGVKAYKVEEKVLGGPYYSRVITWIATDSFLPLQRDYYDEAGRLWKSELFKEVTTIDRVPTPLVMEMKDLQTGYVTVLRVTDVVNDTNIPDEFFDPKQLSKIADSPLWKTYSPQAVKGK